MTDARADGATLRVRRHLARCRLPRGSSADGVRASLDFALGELLAEPLASQTRQSSERDGTWLIRRLDVHAGVASRWSARRIAREVAVRIAGELANTLEHGADGEAVLWFPDRAAFLAQYLIDCADGRSGGRWQYAEFGAGDAGTSVALREAMVREPSTALDALVQLRVPDLRRVLEALTPSDAEGVLLAFDQSGRGSADPVALVVESVRRLVERCELPEERRAAALTIVVEVARYHRVPQGIATRARDAAFLASVVGGAPNDRVAHLATMLEFGDWRAVVREIGAHAMAALSGLASWPPTAREDVVRTFAGASAGRPERAPASEQMTTRLGGIFLLLPLVEQFPWDRVTADWPTIAGVDAALVGRYLTVIGALGRPRQRAALRDAALRLALGVPLDLDSHTIVSSFQLVPPDRLDGLTSAFAEYLQNLGRPADMVAIHGITEEEVRYFELDAPLALPERLRTVITYTSRALLRELAWRLPGFSTASPGYLWDNFLACEAAIDIEPTRFVVRMTNAPLNVVLSLTGLNRKRFRLAATGDTEWVLTQAS